ncbi:hypothetical protein ACJMK2_024002 [Sinanodonta woodiana]|uniref:Receptor protein-tyrosine kinase n=1 Tax=Sinanodonta woodiana TaxID=1069815 RepID=A0ABD3T6K4_SINWO
MPFVSRSRVTLAHVRRTDNTTKFSYSMDGTSAVKDTFWSNQKDFNYLNFEFYSVYMSPQLPFRPLYITDAQFGIVDGYITVNISKIPRSGTNRDVASQKQYKCPGIADTNPNNGMVDCKISDNQFSVIIEHGDWLNVVFIAKSGGFRNLVNFDQPNNIWETQIYQGLTDKKEVEFKFDFYVPTHCSEPNITISCRINDVPLKIENEFTKFPVNISWAGWKDDLSKMDRYHIEVFKLSPDPYDNLQEMTPLKPVHSDDVNHTHDGIYQYTYTPSEEGMFSVLLQAVDKANNSKIARRLFLYAPTSNISLNTRDDGRLYISSAEKETGYMWQTTKAGQTTEVKVEWKNHFINKFISEGKLLNKVNAYPIQFQDIQREGILQSSKLVFPGFDDNEGQRTVDEKPNKNGIVRFEAVISLSDGTNEPQKGWFDISGLAENFKFTETLRDGRIARVWVRAHDVLGNTISDKTEVYFDFSEPLVKNNSVVFSRNHPNGTYIYTSRIEFEAADKESGVHKIGYILKRDDTGKVQHNGSTFASHNNISCNTEIDCICVLEKCFIKNQVLDLDNCWFMTSKEELDHANITVEVTVYNQAMLKTSFYVTVDKLNELRGLEHYSGPTNIRVAKSNANGVRLEWDLPKTQSCYGRTEIVVILYLKDGATKVYTVSRNTTFVDIIGLDPERDYKVNFSLGYGEQRMGNMPFSFQTAAKEDSIPTAAIVGGVLAAVAIIGLLIAIFIVLLRRGRLEPVRRRLSRFTVRYRNTVRGQSNLAYDTNTFDDLYIYGGMKFDERQPWHMNRDDVVFESLLTSGRFANIYKASLKSSSVKRQQTVVAKTLKEGFSEKDKELMMAKINFTGTQVGNHPNVLKFIGAVIDDDAIGPFIILEYCENGPLKNYLETQRNNITVELQEKMFRFGLDICKGMEYLASKNIIHRRLAARNIFLTIIYEVRISGFGPQNFEQDDNDGDSEKKERIPIKWMAPECMKSTAGATEKSDVWSFGVVLWEIFSLGESPFENIRSRDVPARLKKGERPSKPELCDDTWYGVMQRAWNIAPEKRPTFSEIREELDQLFVQSAGDDYYYYKR